MSATPAPLSEAELIGRVAQFEEQKAIIAAEQAEAILAFARAHALSQGATRLVVGRPITAAPDPRAAALAIVEEMRAA